MWCQIQKPVEFILKLNRGIRTILAWYRSYARGKISMKNMNATDEAIMSSVVEQLELPPPAVKDEVGTWNIHGGSTNKSCLALECKPSMSS